MTADIPPGSVIVTPDDMWKAIEENRDTSRRIELAVTELKLMVNPALSEIRDDIAKLDARVFDLEKASWSSRWVPALVTSLLMTVVGGVVLYLVTRGLTP